MLLSKVLALLPGREVFGRAAEKKSRGMRGIDDGHHTNVLHAADVYDEVRKGMSRSCIAEVLGEICRSHPEHGGGYDRAS